MARKVATVRQMGINTIIYPIGAIEKKIMIDKKS
jgi:hypothetical protein